MYLKKPVLVLKRGCNIVHKLDNNIDPIQNLIYTSALRELLKIYLSDNRFDDCPWKLIGLKKLKKWEIQMFLYLNPIIYEISNEINLRLNSGLRMLLIFLLAT